MFIVVKLIPTELLPIKRLIYTKNIEINLKIRYSNN